MSWIDDLLKQAQSNPALLQTLQSTGMLGKTIDATGGMETDVSSPNNIGGGLLGKGGGLTPDKMMQMGLLAASAGGQHQQPPQARPFAFQAPDTKLAPQNTLLSEQEKRRRLMAQIFQGG